MYRVEWSVAPLMINLGNGSRWMVNFIPRPLYPGEENHGAHWTGERVGPRNSLNTSGKREISCCCR